VARRRERATELDSTIAKLPNPAPTRQEDAPPASGYGQLVAIPPPIPEEPDISPPDGQVLAEPPEPDPVIPHAQQPPEHHAQPSI